MAYVTTNPPILVISTNNFRLWVYVSADAIATVDGTAYFSNASDLGLQEDDIMFVVNTAGNLTTIAKVGAVATSATVIALTAVP